MVQEHLQEYPMSDNPYASPTTAPTVPVAAGTMRIRRIGVLQMAKVMAITYALISVIVVVPMMLFMMVAGGGNGAGVSAIAMLFAPILYGIAGFIGGAVGAFVYNLVAGWVGGMEIELVKA